MSIDADEQLRALTEHAVEVVPLDQLREKIASGRPLRIKHGVDPTAPHVHLGWAVPLRKLRQFQDLGHTAVLVLGDFTARIGDPSGQDKTRPMLSKEDVDAHAAAVLSEIRMILSPDRLEVRPNSEWLEALGTQGVLELTSEYTVARTLERDDFAERFASGTAITLREFLYPLLQAYDSVAVEADVEIGGTDQHHTFMVARHIQRAYGQDPQVVMTFPLLEGTDGVKKMSQSLGNYIGITESPDEMFGKVMRIPDELMGKYFRLATNLPEFHIQTLEKDFAPQDLKRVLAGEIVYTYHGESAAKAAHERFDRIFVEHEAPDDIPEQRLPDVETVYLPHLLVEWGAAESSSSARRLISQGGVQLNGEVVRSEEVPVETLRGGILRVGKRRFYRPT